MLVSRFNDDQAQEDQLRFGEYMTPNDSCWPCLRNGNKEEEYAMQILATEIYTLKRTIKEVKLCYKCALLSIRCV